MIKIKTLYPLMIEAFQEGKSFSFPVKGTSMQPLLHSNDVVTIIPKKEYNVGDIVLFNRSDDEFVLHRIIKKRNDFFDIVGDHQTRIEKNVSKDKIIGCVISYSKKGEINNLDTKRYQFYKFIVRFRVFRFLFSKLK